MKKLRFILFLLFSLFCKLFFSQAYLNEIIVKPNGSATGAEYQSLWFPSTSPYGSEGIEIYNPHCSTLDISNWILVVNGAGPELKGILRFPSGTSIPAGGRIVIGAPGTNINNSGSDVAIAVPASNTFANYRANGYLNTGDNGRLYLDNSRGYVALYQANGTPVDCVYWVGNSATGEAGSQWGTSWGSTCSCVQDVWDTSIGLGAGPASNITNIPQGDYGSLVAASTLATPGSTSLNAVSRFAGNNIGNSGAGSIQNVGDGLPTCQRVENITFGSANAGTPITCIVLPIELISFDYVCNNNQIKLNWSTATETNNSHFTILGSSDAIEWMEVGNVVGAGNSLNIVDYNYDVPTEFSNLKYFKLAQTDYDGRITHSNILYTDCEKYNQVDFFPNPFNNELNFKINSNESVSYEITTVLGQIVNSGNVNKGNSRISLENLASDIYFIKINNSKVYKIIKQ